jgi:ectoine hydrolase
MPAFETAEYRRRIRLAKERMAKAGIDVLLVTSPENMNYLTGYDGWSFYTHQIVALAQDAEEPVLILRKMDVACAIFTVWIDHANIVGYPESYIESSERHEMDFIAGELARRGWGSRRLAVEMDSYYFSARAYERLTANLPDARFQDAERLVNWVRLVKSEPEVACMRQAAKIAERGMQTAVETVRPGVRECDAAAAVVAALISGTKEYGGDAPLSPSMPTGPKTFAPHLLWTDEPYKANQACSIELGGCRLRYHAGLSRTLHLGPPPASLDRLAKVTAEGQKAALDAVRAGTTAESVEAAWRAVISRHGFEKESRIGYSIGLGYTPNWGEQTVSLRPGDRNVLQPNMCFHMIVGMWLESGGFELSETFRVTEQGCEVFASFPRELIVIR